MLTRAYLYERLAETQAADGHQAKRIAELMRIFGLKRKADADYRSALEQVNEEINRYLEVEQLFLCDLIKSYQSFLAIAHQHKQTLLEGYDQEILGFLATLKESRASESVGKKARFAEQTVAKHIELLRQCKQKLKEVDDDIEVLRVEVRFKERVNALSEIENKMYSERLKAMVLAREARSTNLEKELEELCAVSQVYFQTYKDVGEYQQQYLNEKTNDIIDTVMRVFVLEVAYIRSVQNDVAGILKRLKESKDETKRITTSEVDCLLRQSPKQNLKGRLWDAYKTLTQSQPFTLDDAHVPEAARKRWLELCQSFMALDQ